MEINFSRGDLLAGQPITPGYYKGSIVKEEMATREGVLDYVVTFDFDDPLLAADERTVKHTFFNFAVKGKGFLVPYMAALLNRDVKSVVDGLNKGEQFPFSIGDGVNVGKKIQFKLVNEIFQGRPQNRLETFLPHSAEAPQF